jgi:hypothetical protein
MLRSLVVVSCGLLSVEVDGRLDGRCSCLYLCARPGLNCPEIRHRALIFQLVEGIGHCHGQTRDGVGRVVALVWDGLIRC